MPDMNVSLLLVHVDVAAIGAQPSIYGWLRHCQLVPISSPIINTKCMHTGTHDKVYIAATFS